MTSRERVLNALNFKPVDRLPRDLGGMRSTCISCFVYPKLVKALGLPPRLPRVYDLGQMLALPDEDVLDALECDVVMAEPDVTNAFEQPDLWKAGGHTVQEWKDKCRGRIAMWGGGVNSQATLPLGSVRDVEDETRRNVRILSKDSGYVFCNIHNILAEIAPEKVIAMYRVAM